MALAFGVASGAATLISEPTGPMTVVMLAGVFQILFGLLRLGRYITQMPYTVISGFMSGIGIILIVLQIGPFLGQAIPKGGVIGTLSTLPALVQNAVEEAVEKGRHVSEDSLRRRHQLDRSA